MWKKLISLTNFNYFATIDINELPYPYAVATDLFLYNAYGALLRGGFSERKYTKVHYNGVEKDIREKEKNRLI